MGTESALWSVFHTKKNTKLYVYRVICSIILSGI